MSLKENDIYEEQMKEHNPRMSGKKLREYMYQDERPAHKITMKEKFHHNKGKVKGMMSKVLNKFKK